MIKKLLLVSLAVICALFFSACKPKTYDLRVVITGDSGAKGKGVHANGKKDLPLDINGPLGPNDHVVVITPNGKTKKLEWDDKLKAFTFDIPNVPKKHNLAFAVYHPSPDPTAPMGNMEPVYGMYVDVLDSSTKRILCTEEIVHYEDLDKTDKILYGPVITGINPDDCLVQGPDTRTVEITLQPEQAE
jgi:hypothetical protein